MASIICDVADKLSNLSYEIMRLYRKLTEEGHKPPKRLYEIARALESFAEEMEKMRNG